LHVAAVAPLLRGRRLCRRAHVSSSALRYFKTTSKLRAGTQLRLPKAVDPERLKTLAAAADAANKAAIACAARAKSRARAKAKAAKAAAAAAAAAPPPAVAPTVAGETTAAAAVDENAGISESGKGASSAASADSAEQNAATAAFAAASTLPALPDDAVVKTEAEPQMTQLMGKTIPAPPVSAPPNQ
jgi:hypothetical protein